MGKNIIFLENRRQASVVLNILKEGKNNLRIIALTPEVCYLLDKVNIAYDILENHISEVLHRDMTNFFFRHTSMLTEYLDKFFSSRIPILEEINLIPFRKAFYSLYHILASLMIKMRMLKHFISYSKEEIGKILYFPEEVKSNFDKYPDIPLLGKETLYSRLIPLVAKAEKVACEPIVTREKRDANANKKYDSFKNKIKLILRKSDLLKKIYIIKNFLPSRNIRRRFYKNNVTILTLGCGYDLRKILKDFCAEGNHNILLWDTFRFNSPFYIWPVFKKFLRVKIDKKETDRLKEKLVSVWANILEEEEFKSFFRYLDIDYFNIVEERLTYYTISAIPRLFTVYFISEYLIKQCNVKLLLSTGAYNSLYRAIMAACKNKGIPVVIYQHGSMGG